MKTNLHLQNKPQSKRVFQHVFLFIVILIGTTNTFAQSKEGIDPSKPTNIYSRINNNVEYTKLKDGTQFYGYRFNYSYAFNDFQTTVEVPFLYNNKTNSLGLDDIRIRTFYVPYTNYEKTIGGLGLSMDIFLPTGDTEYGLGSGTWSFSPGVIAGIIVSDNYSIWPIASYRMRYKPSSIPEDEFVKHGFTLMVMNSINISDKIYVTATPMFVNNNMFQSRENDYGGELEFNYMLKDNKIQLGLFTRQLLESETQSYRLMVRIYL